MRPNARDRLLASLFSAYVRATGADRERLGREIDAVLFLSRGDSMSHLPGPYQANLDPLAGVEGWVISDVKRGAVLGHAFDAVHADLFAAAPELLSALRSVRRALKEVRELNPGNAEDADDGASEWLGAINAVESRCDDAIRAAIAKATGK